MRYKKTLIILVLISTLASAAVLADEYAYTQAYFNVPSDVSFKISLPGDAASPYESSEFTPPTTTWISFNATSLPASNVEPWTEGVDGDANRQNGATYPIFYVENFGNTPIDFYIQIESLDACLSICANAICGDTACPGATFTTTCTPNNINGVEAIMVDELPDTDGSDHANVTLYAGFGALCTPGELGPYQITHRSTAD